MSEENTKDEAQVQIEQEARQQGWTDKDEWRGAEEDWIDAATFVKRGKEILPVLQKNNERLLQRLSKAEKDAEEARKVAKEFREYQKTTFEAKVKTLETELKELRQAKKEAITQGDGDRVVELDEQIDAVKEQHAEAKAAAEKPVPVEPEVTLDPALNSWLERNDWFGKNTRLTSIANSLGAELRKENPSVVGDAFLKLLDEELAPYLEVGSGKKKSREPVSPVEGRTNSRPGAPKKQSYENLPEEAKQACDRFVKQGLMTKEEYVAEYDWSE